MSVLIHRRVDAITLSSICHLPSHLGGAKRPSAAQLMDTSMAGQLFGENAPTEHTPIKPQCFTGNFESGINEFDERNDS